MHLSEALQRGACPVCAARSEAVSSYLTGLLWESVNDPTTRAELDKARGFCPAHIRELVDNERQGRGGGSLGSAILLGAFIRRRLEELRTIGSARGRAAAHAAAKAAAPASCPVCAESQRAGSSAVGRLVRLVSDPAWQAALASAPFCLPDLLLVWSASADEPGWAAISEAQLARIEHLETELEAFAHNNSHDRMQLLTDEQKASVGAAVSLLSGNPGRKR
jgi:Family of unknown function (DUF6062)